MRSYEEFESLIYSGGDMLFSAILSVTGSRQKTLEVITQAAEKYIESRKRLKNPNEKYRYMAKICERILRSPLSNAPVDEFLTDEERGKILAVARMYIGTGGKDRKRLWMIITVGVILVIISIIVVYKLNFIVSDEFDSGWVEWLKKEEAVT